MSSSMPGQGEAGIRYRRLKNTAWSVVGKAEERPWSRYLHVKKKSGSWDTWIPTLGSSRSCPRPVEGSLSFWPNSMRCRSFTDHVPKKVKTGEHLQSLVYSPLAPYHLAGDLGSISGQTSTGAQQPFYDLERERKEDALDQGVHKQG
ncbi:hypothetical protein MPH_06241 [Macrophomina phaseolina MS6]|uniref:Uncharacterized protein n=1 Tax=Macrophomina phaseolina (strain MS6) TaxID=1126212 RepID=K2SI04_MACPH|nr:hypothetical protein MPH_06241 [Macrophomina phaseolina MS6]